MLSEYAVVYYVLMTHVQRHAVQVIIVMIVWNNIIAVGVRVKITMAKGCVLKQLCMVGNVFAFEYKITKLPF